MVDIFGPADENPCNAALIWFILSSYAIGIALRKEDSINIISKEAETKIINKLCHVIRSGNLTSDQLTLHVYINMLVNILRKFAMQKVC